MTSTLFKLGKPVAAAGFLLSALSLSSWAQTYVDVEAERASAGMLTSEPATAPTASSTGTSGYAGGAIRPYSGQTTFAAPVSTQPIAVTPATDTGSMVVQVQQLQEDVRRLNGVVEELLEEIQRLKEQSLERYVDLDRRLASGNVTVPSAASTTDAAVTPPSVSPAASSLVAEQPGEQAAYQYAYGLVKAREFSQAVTAFGDFLGEYPFGRYAPNAHYWLGELYLVLDPPDPELARQNFKLLLDQYPTNPKVPDALYKLGRVQHLKGNRERAREYLDRVIRDYPDHPAARLAQDFLAQNF